MLYYIQFWYVQRCMDYCLIAIIFDNYVEHMEVVIIKMEIFLCLNIIQNPHSIRLKVGVVWVRDH